MPLINRDTLVIGERQRSDINQNDLTALKTSILGRGLLHPPVVRLRDDGMWELLAGERRVRATDLIQSEGLTYNCNGEIVPPGKLFVTLNTALSDVEMFEVELDENLYRVDLPWQDKTRALDKLHRLRKAENASQTAIQTAREIVDRSPGTEDQKPSLATTRVEVARAAVVAQHLSRANIANARTQEEAYRIVMAEEQNKYQAELIRRKQMKAEAAAVVQIRAGSAFDILPNLDVGFVDLILSDPPYGVNAGGSGYRARSALHHNYEDTEAYAREILQLLLVEGFRLCKNKANIFLFTDIKHFSWLQTAASQMGWTPWRYPIIWQKSKGEGLVPWGAQGFAHTYDVIFWATKGQRGIRGPMVDIIDEARVGRADRIYAAEKPIPLLKKLIEASTLPGDFVLDPCAGSGSTLAAAKELKRNGLGIEIDPSVVDMATVRLAQGEEAYTNLLAKEPATPTPSTEGDIPEGLEPVTISPST